MVIVRTSSYMRRMDTMSMRIRMATENDAKQILNIYNYYIKTTAVTFEYDEVSEEEYAERIRDIMKVNPFLVCEINQEIVGYAYYGMYAKRAAFAWDVESTVYLNPEYKGKNVACSLYNVLIEIGKLQGYYNVYALIETSNIASIKFHEKLGFITVGTMPNIGYKFGQWWGLTEMNLRIGDFDREPEKARKINELDQNQIEKILSSHSLRDVEIHVLNLI